MLVASCAADETSRKPGEIVIGLIPEINIFKQMERFAPLARYLKDETGHPVRFTVLTRYGNIIENFEQGHLDGAFFGSFTGALAIKKLGVVPLARPVNENGKSTYSGFIFVRKDSGISGISAMRGKRFAFVEKATTAGYIFPLAYFHDQGIKDINTFLGESYFSGSHDASVYAVLEGKAAIGAAKDSMFELIAKKDPRIAKEIVILARSGEYPSNGLGVRKDMDETLQAKLKSALLRLHETPQGQKVLQSLHFTRFIETKAADYQPVFDVAKKARIDLKNYHYLND